MRTALVTVPFPTCRESIFGAMADVRRQVGERFILLVRPNREQMRVDSIVGTVKSSIPLELVAFEIIETPEANEVRAAMRRETGWHFLTFHRGPFFDGRADAIQKPVAYRKQLWSFGNSATQNGSYRCYAVEMADGSIVLDEKSAVFIPDPKLVRQPPGR